MEENFLEFEWDLDKAQRNLRKHRVSFREGMMVFKDIFAITFYDDAHSRHEQRFLTLGISDLGRVLVISHTMVGDKVRLISARKATKHERQLYEKENEGKRL